MKYYIITGEASGDLHASNLMKELKVLDPDAEFRCWGGDLMQKQGGTLVKHYRDLSFMGFLEVLMNIRKISANLSFCKHDLIEYSPDVLILVDYPGFNLRVARFAHNHGLRVYYYISPQLWAWHSSRVKKIKAYVNRMFVILPFEKEFYRDWGYEVDFFGHPLLDVIDNVSRYTDKVEFLRSNGFPEQKPLIALLPGSRKQEITKILKIMLSVVPDFPEYNFVIAGAPSISTSFYQNLTTGLKVPVIQGETYNLVRYADAALVTSGTATLETALIGTPEIVCYKGGAVSYLLARLLVHVKFISLVNLVMDKEVVKELIQGDLTHNNLVRELKMILYNTDNRKRILQDYSLLREKLGGSGASRKVAGKMIQYMTDISV